MRRAGGSGLILVAIVMVILGVVLRWDLIKWLIDATGMVLIVVGVILGIVGLISFFTGGRSKSSDF
jgi:nitrogen fixation-related uncharacterized protein